MGTLSFDTSSMVGWLFESTLYISILICIIFILKAVTRGKLPAWWSYGLWLLLIFRMLVPWGLESPLSIFNLVPAPPENELYMPVLMEQELYIPFLENAPSALSLDKVLLIIWLAGILFFSINTLFKNLLFWIAIKRLPSVTDRGVLNLFEECRVLLAVQRNVKVVVTDRVKSPALFGYFKPRLLLPPNFFNTLEKDELRYIFLHEIGHMKHHDIGISWLVNVLQVIHWFNPFVWYAFYNMRVDQEVACDAYVLSKLKQVQPADYANTIVDLLDRFIQNRQLPSLAGIIENKSQIKRRITMIMNFKKYTYKMTFISVLMLLIVGLVFFTSSSGLSSENEDSLFVTAYNLNEVDQPPRVIRSLPPKYPFSAVADGIEGRVVLRFVVGADGFAHEAEVVKAEPEGVFEESALAVVVKYNFKPAVINGENVDCIVRLPIQFALSADDKGAFAKAYKLDELNQVPRVLYAEPPVYPDSAKEDGIEGRVVLGFIVGADGVAHEPQVIEAEPEGVFEEAALDAIIEYRFEPAVKNGENVDCIVKMPMKFSLSADE